MSDVLHALPGVAMLLLDIARSKLDRAAELDDLPPRAKDLMREVRDAVETVRKTAGEAQAEIDAAGGV